MTGNYNKLKMDRTKWYRVNYDYLRLLPYTPHNNDAGDVPEEDGDTTHSAKMAACNRPEWPDDADKMTKPIPETSSKTNPKNSAVATATGRRQASSVRARRPITEIERWYEQMAAKGSG